MDSFSELVAVFGRSHPLLLHLPIGMLVGLGMLECVAVIRRQAAASRLLVLIAASSAILGAVSGWVLHLEPGYASSEVLEWHQRLGIATAVGATVCFALRMFAATKFYRMALLLTLVVMAPAGHFGAEMTHGKGFLLAPLEDAEATEIPEYIAPIAEDGALAQASFELHVAPLLKARCHKCHGPRKSKGDLRLDTVEFLLAGGENGPVIASVAEGSNASPPAPEDSEIFARLLLPLEDEDHMPPESKTQLTAAEIELLRAWLVAAAPFEGEFPLADGATLPAPPQADPPPIDRGPAAADRPSSAPESALAALREHLVHVQLADPESVALWIDFAAPAATIDAAMVEELLTPLKDFVGELSLARTHIHDANLELIGSMPRLTRLDLRETAVSDVGLVFLRGQESLHELVLSRTQLTDDVLATLLELPGLTRLWVWDAGLTTEGIATLRQALPQVHIDAGDSANRAALETEAELVFSGEAPLIDSPPADSTPPGDLAISTSVELLVPINSACPVTGKPIDSRYAVVFEGRVIGFCCPNCPKTFWQNPAAFLVTLTE